MRREAGFSLIEMLAALAVLAIAGVALMNALTTGVRAATMAEDATLAGLAAENLLSTEIAQSRGAPLRDRSGAYEIAGRAYQWRLEVARTPQPGLTQITLVVENSEGREAARLVTFMRGDR
ncbi:MAG: type II secretion system minor pseudopilin GspI [Oceanicaulis sp.]